MAEMRILSCPQCEQSNHPKSVVDGIEEYRCRACGIVYYGPCGCDTGARDGYAALREMPALPLLHEDWNMAEPVRVLQYGASSRLRPGGC